MIDTGSFPQGSSVNIIAKVNVPGGAQIGDDNLTTITATSSLNDLLFKTAALSMAVPAGFVNVFTDDDNGAISFMTASPVGTSTYKATTVYYYGWDTAVARLINGNYLYAWINWNSSGGYGAYDIEFLILGANGSIVRPVTNVTNSISGAIRVYNYAPSIAVAPNGSIGLTWYRRLYDTSSYMENYNIYFAALDGSGNLVNGPINITNNLLWGLPTFKNPQITATDDNRFVIAWEQYSSGDVEDIYYAVRDTAGGVVAGVTKLTNDTSAGIVVDKMPETVSQMMVENLVRGYAPRKEEAKIPTLSIYAQKIPRLSNAYTGERKAAFTQFHRNAEQPFFLSLIAEFQERFPHARIIVIPDGHHYCFIAQEELVYNEMRDFFLA